MTDFSTHSIGRRIGRKGGMAFGALALVVAGGAAGAVAMKAGTPAVTMAPATPVAIRTLDADDRIVTVRGRIAEVYGRHFILADGSGRALVDAGRDRKAAVAVGQPMTVQGRFDDGSLHAAFLVGADGKVEQVGGLHRGPRHGPRGGGRDGGPGARPGDDRGPRADAGRTPPPAVAPQTAPGVAGMTPPAAAAAPVAPAAPAPVAPAMPTATR